MEPACRGGVIVWGQHIDGIKGSQQLIGAQHQLKHLEETCIETLSIVPLPMVMEFVVHRADQGPFLLCGAA